MDIKKESIKFTFLSGVNMKNQNQKDQKVDWDNFNRKPALIKIILPDEIWITCDYLEHK